MELLSPAGNFTKLIYALAYGADAVYAGGEKYSLRAQADNFSLPQLKEAVAYCHRQNKKFYLTLNFFPKNSDLAALPGFIETIATLSPDALIVADGGVFRLVKKYAPHLTMHISTQANVTSLAGAEFWYEQGAKRVILARETSLQEAAYIKEKLPTLELEVFVHGAMCISYSGRCLLSAFLNKRSANRGECTHPCRWEYALLEKTRPDEQFTVQEDNYGTYILNSKDLCLLEELRHVQAAGIDSCKIEGRMKSLYYTANVTRVYKEAILALAANSPLPSGLTEELEKVSHRHYTTGFAGGSDCSETQHYPSSAYSRGYQFLGPIAEVDGHKVKIEIKAKFSKGDKLEFIFPRRQDDFSWVVDNLRQEGEDIPFTKPNTIAELVLPKIVPPLGIVRKPC